MVFGVEIGSWEFKHLRIKPNNPKPLTLNPKRPTHSGTKEDLKSRLETLVCYRCLRGSRGMTIGTAIWGLGAIKHIYIYIYMYVYVYIYI